MSQIKGTNFKIYLDADVVAYLKSNSITRSTTEIDITNKESGENKETMPGTREFQCKCEGFIDLVAKNLLVNSEDFESAEYAAINTGSVSATGVTGPSGQLNASTLSMPAQLDGWEAIKTMSIVNGTSLTFSGWIKGSGAGAVQMAITNSLQNDGASIYLPVTTEWQRFSVTYTFTATSTAARIQLIRYLSGHLSSVSIANWQLEVGDMMTTYQPTPRVFTKDLFDAIEAGTAYAASCDDKTATHRKYSGTAYIKNLSQDFPNDDAAQFSCDLMFTGTITTATN